MLVTLFRRTAWLGFACLACSEGTATADDPCVAYGTCSRSGEQEGMDDEEEPSTVNPAHMGGSPLEERSEDVPPGDVEKPDHIDSAGFFVLDGRLYDRYGNDFVMRGVNNAHAWFDTGGRNLAIGALDEIANYGFNSVRIVWETTDTNSGATISLLRQIVDCVVALGMVPMIELHDVTGVPAGLAKHRENGELRSWSSISSEERMEWRPLTESEDAEVGNARLMDMAKYFAGVELKQLLWDYEDYLLINIANEWSGRDWVGGYAAAVEYLRDEGISHTLVIDANEWGQNGQVILDDGARLLETDPQHNLLFSTHMYERYSDVIEITRVLEEATSQQLPLIVGEFGPEHGGRTIDVELIFEEAARLGVGYLAWSWKGNAPDTAHLDMAEDWSGFTLTDWGQTVVDGPNGVRETSQRASLFLL